MDFIKRDF